MVISLLRWKFQFISFSSALATRVRGQFSCATLLESQPMTSEDFRQLALRLPEAAESSHQAHPDFGILAEIALQDSGAMRPFRFDHAGVDRVDTDLAWPQFFGERLRDRIHGGLRAAVDGAGRRRLIRRHRTDIDNAASRGPEMLDGFLRGQQQAKHIEVILLVEMLRGD